MGIRVALHHRTDYRYDRPVALGPHTIRLRPAPHARTPIHGYSLKIEPGGHFLNWQQDPQGNFLARAVFPERTRTLAIEVDLVAELTVFNPFDFFLDDAAERFPFAYEPWLAEEIRPFREAPSPGPLLSALLATIDLREVRTVDFLVELNRRVSREVAYVIRHEPGVQSCEETLARGRGSCRDSAWLLVQTLRHLGLAARFVSGYLIQLVPDVPALDGPTGPPADFTDLHAWAEVYIPGAGWVGLDPTSGLFAGEGHVPLACSPEPASAAPIAGLVDDCDVAFSFAMSVTRLREDPRVTKPYTEDAWARIDALGRAVDARLAAGDVRLSMGGEPTFVSIDDRDGEEWTTAALGPHKRRLAGALVRLLRDRFAAGGFLHFAQGKWYPGESLPRWALGCYWRTDGEPVWKDPSLVADDAIDYGADADAAERFVTALAERLGVDPHFAVPGYEDAWYYLWRERRLPANVDPLDSRLDDPEERVHLARIFDHGLAAVVGFALPLLPAATNGVARWQSAPWSFRTERMYLLPGDSPMGYRLPLASLPWLPKDERPRVVERDPFAGRPPLPTSTALAADRVRMQARGSDSGRPAAPPHVDATLPPADTVRSALCVEPRAGTLHVFLPPIGLLEDYLALVAAVEDTASALDVPVVVEGYPPPFDHRLRKLEVTPDPGVIEVNVHPATGWDELVHITTVLYEEARLCRLATEKFMLDGRHVGTGGGNHVTIGGPTPGDSPLLRRPDLLRSLLAYWQNHPSLSYAFSGLFIGPTSQHPRVDEARNDQLVELETAFRQIPEHGEVPPWLVDRLFRNLLIDATGNTHRAEFCIDKLYAPDGIRGRLGLLELRAFEMPPHARMSLVQQLLVRALVVRFWERPYDARLVRWGTDLHDRFMLPHFVTQDLEDVLRDLALDGLDFEADWLAPHLAFRFPPIGTIVQRGVVLELRQALEPWHVLGEEQGGGGTVRYVDSSLERLQVKVSGMTDGRHLVACNGWQVPLHPTGTNGEFVAGVRYRAWQPAASLHPTIPADAPLVFDVVDTWSGRSIGGCTYHVAHPGGRANEAFPVNANAAEARRVARFTAFGHTPGLMTAPPGTRDPEFPFTLDLRRCRGTPRP